MSEQITENMEEYINNVLKDDLKVFEQYIDKYNEEIMEFVQLKNTIQTIRDNVSDGFKTQLNIGSNIFMEAHVDKLDKILIDIGAKCYLECSLEEALNFAELRIKVLSKEAEVVRKASVHKRAEIKLALFALNEREQIIDTADINKK